MSSVPLPGTDRLLAVTVRAHHFTGTVVEKMDGGGRGGASAQVGSWSFPLLSTAPGWPVHAPQQPTWMPMDLFDLVLRRRSLTSRPLQMAFEQPSPAPGLFEWDIGERCGEEPVVDVGGGACARSPLQPWRGRAAPLRPRDAAARGPSR